MVEGYESFYSFEIIQYFSVRTVREFVQKLYKNLTCKDSLVREKCNTNPNHSAHYTGLSPRSQGEAFTTQSASLCKKQVTNGGKIQLS